MSSSIRAIRSYRVSETFLTFLEVPPFYKYHTPEVFWSKCYQTAFKKGICKGGKIANGSNVLHPDYEVSVNVLTGKPSSFLQVDGTEHQEACGSYSNEEEAMVAVTLVKMLHDASLRNSQASSNSESVEVLPWHSPDKKAVVAITHFIGLGITNSGTSNLVSAGYSNSLPPTVVWCVLMPGTSILTYCRQLPSTLSKPPRMITR
jgi:hypothetical protein